MSEISLAGEIVRLNSELDELQRQLDEAKQALDAIRTGQVESLVLQGPNGVRIFSIEGADHAYRVLVEAMNEGAATISEDGTILYCNACFAEMLDTPLERVMGSEVMRYLPNHSREPFAALVREASSSDSRAEVELLSQGGEIVPAYISLSAIRDEKNCRFCMIATDLRAQKRNQEIVAAERLARSVIEQAAEAIVVCDEVGRIIQAGAAAARLCGSNPLRRNFDEAFALEFSTLEGQATNLGQFHLSSIIAAAREGSVIRAVPANLVHPDGSRTELLISATVLHATDECVHGYVINLVDVSDSKRARDALRLSEERFRIALRNSPVVVSTQDLNLRYTWHYNAQLGYTDDAAIGKTDYELLPPDAAASISVLKRNVIASGEAARDILSVQHDGEQHYFDITAEPQRDSDGSIVGVTNVAIEITEQKRAEDALSDANFRLADADTRKNEFLAMLSHELRNPLFTITNSLHVLERAVPGSPPARRSQLVISRQTAQLSRLVDDLLDVTRFSQNKIQLRRQTLDLNELVRTTVEDHRALFERGEVSLVFEAAAEPVYVNADLNRVAQIIGNLLQNASKFTDQGCRTRVSVSSDPATRLATVSVSDNGTGMAPEVLKNLFQPFMQADHTLHRSRGGLGLGLALVRRLVELHGGYITAHSPGLGHGSEFVVRLPLEIDVTLPKDEHLPKKHSARRVLIIEDNIDAAESLKDMLEFTGYEVQVAHDGPDGLAQARKRRPDIVFCDIGLPGMDGYEFARAFRTDNSLKSSLLVALTGYAMPNDLQRARQAGFDDHLAKPASFQKIEEMLGSLLSKTGTKDADNHP